MQGTDKTLLRDLLTQNAKPLYQRALDRTGNAEKAKEILRTVVRESTAAAETRLISAEWLNELCDMLSEPEQPAPNIDLRHDTPIPDEVDEDLSPEEAESLSSYSYRPSEAEVQLKEETEAKGETEAEEHDRFGSPAPNPDDRSRQVSPRRVQRTMPAEPYSASPEPVRTEKAAAGGKEYGFNAEIAESSKPYSLEEDDWINEIREQRRHPAREEKEKGGSRGLYNAAIALCIPMILILLWIVAGLLMKNGALPYSDLGYDWFNANFWPLF